MPEAAPIKPAQLARFRELVSSAASGTAPWLDGLIRDAGYVRLEEGVTQAEIVRECGVTRHMLLDWELEGLPAVKEGTTKRYPLLKLVAWMKSKFVRGGRPREGDGDEWDQRGRAASARLKELNLDKEMRTLIPRLEAEGTQSGMVTEMHAALFALASQLPSQLENRDAPAIRGILHQQFTYLCRQMGKGRVPMPEVLHQEVDAALERYERRRRV